MGEEVLRFFVVACDTGLLWPGGTNATSGRARRQIGDVKFVFADRWGTNMQVPRKKMGEL
jgi:hypothetical protein